jgi:hypothetical protein
MPDRGIRRRGAVSGHPFPSEDLDAYVKELVSRSSAEVGASSRHLISDFGTPPAAGDPIATNYGSVGSFLIWVTAAGQVKRLWLSGEASNGASGYAGATKIEAMPDGAFVFYGSAGTKTSLNSGSTLGTSWTHSVSSVYYHEHSGRYVTMPTGSNAKIRFFSTLADASTGANLLTDTALIFGADHRFINSSSEYVHVSNYVPAFNRIDIRKISPTTGNHDQFESIGTPINHTAQAFRGLIISKLVSSGVSYFRQIGISETGSASDSSDVYPSNVTLSTTSVPIVVGNLVFDEDAAGDWLWYSTDLVTWRPHSPLDASDTIRMAVGSRLLTNGYISGPCI